MTGKTEEKKPLWVEIEHNHRYSIFENTKTGEKRKERDPAR